MSDNRKRRQICLKFTDTPTDRHIYRHIQKQPNKAEYIRRLVRSDMEREAARKAFEEEILEGACYAEYD